MAKYIYIKMDNKDVFKLESSVIAEYRASYYALLEYNKTNGSSAILYDNVWEVEYNTGMDDNDKLIDWLRGNMDWDDISDVVEHVEHEDSPDYGDLYSHAMFYVEEA